jgi:drug/metabolite transporter (DMT)-like permease
MLDSDSIRYLPLAEATVFRFLTPVIMAWACSIFLGQVFTAKQLAAGLAALIRVVFIAHPKSVFGPIKIHTSINEAGPVDDISSTQLVVAVAVALVSVVGQSGAYTMIRVIGNQAHTLIQSITNHVRLNLVGTKIGREGENGYHHDNVIG